jgi:hypothetical protein
MKKGILALVLTMVMAGNALAQTRIFILSNPSASWGNLRQVGSSLDVVGKFNKNSAPAQPIAWNTSATVEYTFHMTGMVLDQYLQGSGAGNDSSRYGAGGTISIYEGTPVNAALGVNPPNATSPSTFTDGTLVLTGTINDLLVTLKDAAGTNPDSTGTARGSVTFTGGSKYGELVANCRADGWTFNVAVSTQFSGTLPAGYNLRWSGELLKNDCPPVSTEPTTWGSVKGLFQ